MPPGAAAKHPAWLRAQAGNRGMCRSADRKARGCCFPAGPRGRGPAGALWAKARRPAPLSGTAACGSAGSARRGGGGSRFRGPHRLHGEDGFELLLLESARRARPSWQQLSEQRRPPAAFGPDNPAPGGRHRTSTARNHGRHHQPPGKPRWAGLVSLEMPADFIGRAALERPRRRRVSRRAGGAQAQGRGDRAMASRCFCVEAIVGGRRSPAVPGHRRLAKPSPWQRASEAAISAPKTCRWRFAASPNARLW